VIVPILVGAIDKLGETRYGEQLAPYLSKEDTLTVVSSDFCHWFVKVHAMRPSFLDVALLQGNQVSIHPLLS
jgi:predicted class III extradiol MEMO1 family dioxygenase